MQNISLLGRLGFLAFRSEISIDIQIYPGCPLIDLPRHTL
jgi:hypothetical protein